MNPIRLQEDESSEGCSRRQIRSRQIALGGSVRCAERIWP